MKLLTRLRNTFGRDQKNVLEQTPPQEKTHDTLVAALLPKKIFTDNSYKDMRGIVKEPVGTYFDSCALDIGKHLVDAYGVFFDVSKQKQKGLCEYRFKHEDKNVSYTVQGVDRFESKQEVWSNDITALLTLEATPTITYASAGKLFNNLLQTHLLDYRQHTQDKFGIFLHKDKQPISAGTQLLKELKIKPTEAAEYIQVMMYGGYKRKTFSDDELRKLGF